MPTSIKGNLGPASAADEAAAQGQLVPLSGAEIDTMLLSGVTGVAREITENMLEAEDFDGILGTTEPTSALVGVTFALKSWKWLRSTKPGGSGLFAVLEIVDLNGRERVITTGSQNCLTFLRWLEKVPARAKQIPPLSVRESETVDGNTVYRFVKAAA
jgi:hypothetical protein